MLNLSLKVRDYIPVLLNFPQSGQRGIVGAGGVSKQCHNFRDNPTSALSVFIHVFITGTSCGLEVWRRAFGPPPTHLQGPHPPRRAGLLKLPTGWIL